MSPIAARSALLRSAAARTVARRQMSAQPKMHKSKDKWADMISQRPPKDHLDEHVSRIGINCDEFWYSKRKLLTKLFSRLLAVGLPPALQWPCHGSRSFNGMVHWIRNYGIRFGSSAVQARVLEKISWRMLEGQEGGESNSRVRWTIEVN
jgi:hypothetical protein